MDTTVNARAGALLRWVRRNRPIVDAAGIAAVSVIAAAIGLGQLWDALTLLPEPVSPWWGVALAVPAIACVAGKRRYPRIGLAVVAVLWTVSLFTVGSLGALLALLDLLWTVTMRSTPSARHRILLACIAGTVGLAAMAIPITGDPRIAVLLGLQFGALLGSDYWWATAVAQANELAELHRLQAMEVVRDAERDRNAALQRERDVMARELHDLVAGHVSAMAIRAEAALTSSRNAEVDGAALRAVRDSSLEAHQALRSMIAVLRAGGGELSVPPGIARLPEFVEDARRAGLEVTLDLGSEAIPASIEQTAVRVVQESLANCVRHAAGGRVAVSIEAEERAVVVRVDSRDGRPLARPSLPGNGSGLEMLGERVRALGGRLEAGPMGVGWSVRATFPMRVPA
ncbi:MAG: sensor histidine kinase [Agromyces sp.]